MARPAAGPSIAALLRPLQTQPPTRKHGVRQARPPKLSPGLLTPSLAASAVASHFERRSSGIEQCQAVPEVAELHRDAFQALPANAVGPETLGVEWRRVAHLNRYVDVLPNAHTRVPLQQDDRAEGRSSTEYINANFVRGFDGSPRRYIAAQGPLRGTAEHFWRMLWQQDSTVVVMVTGLMENGVHKCDRYWPSEDGASGERVYGNLVVTLISTKDAGAYVHSMLQVRSKGEVECRKVDHFWYRAWPDHGVPEDPGGLLGMLGEVRAHGGEDVVAVPPPWIVHCSAGIGRTGAFLALDLGSRQLEHTGRADVVALVQTLRQDRGGMVQTAGQAGFVHGALVSTAARRGLP